MEQNKGAAQGRGIQENNFGKKIDLLLRFFIQDFHADGFAFFLIVDDRMHDRMSSQGHIPRLGGKRKDACITTKISTIRTATIAHVAALTSPATWIMRQR